MDAYMGSLLFGNLELETLREGTPWMGTLHIHGVITLQISEEWASIQNFLTVEVNFQTPTWPGLVLTCLPIWTSYPWMDR
jgi:hypothetical protein